MSDFQEKITRHINKEGQGQEDIRNIPSDDRVSTHVDQNTFAWLSGLKSDFTLLTR